MLTEKPTTNCFPFLFSAFSVLELLVVIAIIALLAGLLMPATLAAKRRAESVYCKGNLRQLGIAVRLYAEDNGGLLPDLSDETSQDGISDSHKLKEVLQVYVSNSERIFYCKADKPRQSNIVSYVWNTRLSRTLLDRRDPTEASGSGQTSRLMIQDRENWHGYRNAVFTDGRVDKSE